MRAYGKTFCRVVCFSSLFLSSVMVASGSGEVASCQAYAQGSIISCTEFASSKSIPGSLEKICLRDNLGNVAWGKQPCPRAGTIGYCEVPRKDFITHVVYCYKRPGVPDNHILEVCRRTCKGRFAPF